MKTSQNAGKRRFNLSNVVQSVRKAFSSWRSDEDRQAPQRSREASPQRRNYALEALEPRLLLSADLSYLANSNSETELTLSFSGSDYQLLTGSGTVVDSLSKADAESDGRIVISGTDGADSLKIDLSDLGSPVLSFEGGGDDTLLTSADVDFSLTGTSIVAADKRFEGFEIATLSGGAGNNRLTLDQWNGRFSFAGGDGNDSLQGDAQSNRWQLAGSKAGTLNGNAFSDLEVLKGGTNEDELRGPTADATWTLTGNSAGTVAGVDFTGMEILTGAAGNTDSFEIKPGAAFTTVLDGGAGGNDILIGLDAANTWNLNGENAGTVGALRFTGIESLRGGAADDAFVFADGNARLSGEIDGGSGGSNTLNYASLASAIAVDFSARQATATGGIAAINRVIGGQGTADTLVGPNNDIEWQLSASNAGSVGDIVFAGFEKLRGADGNDDTFVIKFGGDLNSGLEIDGGAGGDDKLVFDRNGSQVSFAPGAPGRGSIDVGWVRVDYAGLEPGGFLLGSDPLQLFSDFSDPANVKLSGHVVGANDLLLSSYSPGTPELLQISSGGEAVIFKSPQESLSIAMGGVGAENRLTIGELGGAMNLPGSLTITGALGTNIVEQFGDLVIGQGGLSMDGQAGTRNNFTLSGSIDVQGGDVRIDGGLFADTIVLDGRLAIEGGALSIDGSPLLEIPLIGQDQVTLAGRVETQGGAVTVDASRINVAGGTLLTRKFDAAAPSVSTGDSGAIAFTSVKIVLEADSALLADVGGSSSQQAGDVTLSVSVTDPTGALPIDVIPGTDPGISLQNGALIKGGAVALTAYKVNQTQTSLLPVTLLSVQSRNVSIDLTGATIEGDEVSVEASVADKNLLADSGPSTLIDNLSSPIVATFVATPILASIPMVLQAVSVMMRQASTAVSLTDSHIRSAGNVSIAANTSVSSEAAPAGAMDPAKGKYYASKDLKAGAVAPFAAGYSRADGSAVTLLTGGSTITALGDVAIESNTETTANVDAMTMVNSGPAGKKANSKSIKDTTLAAGMSIAVTDSNTRSTATVDQAVIIDAQGSVTVNASGEVNNEASASTYVFIDGSGAIGIAVGQDKSDIKTTVNGTIKAAAVSFGDQGSAITAASFDLQKDTLTLPDHGFAPGQEIVLAGDSYRVIVVDENTIQLAHGKAIKLDASGTDADATQTLARTMARTFEAVTAVDAARNTLTLTGHGLSTGQQVSYHALNSDAAAIGGLDSGASYTVLRVDANHLKLATELAPDGAPGEQFTFAATTYYVLDLADSAALKTTVSFDPSSATANGEPVLDDANDAIVLDADDDFYTGQAVIYSAASPIAGLVSGHSYYVIKGAGAADRLQLAASKADAEAEVPVFIPLGAAAGGGSQTLTGAHLHALAFTEAPLSFTPQEAIGDGGESKLGTTITFDSAHGWQTGDAVVYHVDPTLQREVGVIRHTHIETAAVVVEGIDPSGLTIDGEMVVDGAQGTIAFDGAQPFVTGQRVTYASGGGTAIGGLADGDYFVIDGAPDDLVSTNKLRLAATRADAFNGIALALSTSGNTGAGSQHSLTASAVDSADDLLIIANNSFHTGQKLLYNSAGQAPIGGLQDQHDYYVIRVAGSSDMIRLAMTLDDASRGVAIDLSAGAGGSVHMFTTDRMVTPFDALRSAAVVDLGTATLFLPGHGFQPGEVVTYSSDDGEPIGGLISGGAYAVIVVDADHLRLAAVSAPSQALPLNSRGSTGFGTHSLAVVRGEADDDAYWVPFNPTLLPAVDAASDTLWIQGEHGFKNGERVTYLTGGGAAIGGLQDGQDYFVIVTGASSFQLEDANHQLLQLTAGVASEANGEAHAFERAALGERVDAHIGGLSDDNVYYVTVVNATTIRLSHDQMTARALLPVDLTALKAVAESYDGLALPAAAAGINVQASLEAENHAIAITQIGGIPTIAQMLTGAVPFDHKTAKQLVQGAKLMKVGKQSPVSIAGSVAINLVEHAVRAELGGSAVLESKSSVTVDAGLENKVQIIAQGTVTSEAAQAKSGNLRPKSFSNALGVGIGIYENTVEAIVDSGAQLDAAEKVAVSASLSYPLLIDSLPFSQGGYNISDDNPLADLATLLNGNLGLTGMMNVWASATSRTNIPGKTDAAKFSTTGSMAMTDYRNRSEASIRSGALINQKAAFQNAEQSVELLAQTEMALLNVAGQIQLNLRPEYISSQLALGGRPTPFSLVGNDAGGLGVGGSILVQAVHNQTIALLEGGAQVHTGLAGGLNVAASEDIWSLEMAEAGGDSGNTGISGSFSYVGQVSESIAQIASGAIIDGGAVVVEAESLVSHINLVGAVQKARALGVGMSIGVTLLERETAAVIGQRISKDDQSVGAAGTAISATSLDLSATNDGRIWGIGVAGAVIFEGGDQGPPSSSKSLLPAPLQGPGKNLAPQSGVGLAGVVTANNIADRTHAYINDAGSIDLHGGPLGLLSADHTSVFSLSGAASFVKTAKNSAAIAGSFSNNEVAMDTAAFIAGATLEDTGAVSLGARRDGDVVAITAGVAVAAALADAKSAGASNYAGSLGAAVSINRVQGQTRALIDDATVVADGDLSLTADDRARISALAIGGALSAGVNSTGTAGALAGAGAGISNEINLDIEAGIRNGSVVIVSGGGVLLAARDETTVSADAGGVGVALAFAKTGSAYAASLGVAVALNDINNRTRASISAATVSASGDIVLAADDEASVAALAIGGALAVGLTNVGSGVAFAGAGAASSNSIALASEASIKDGSVVLSGAALSLRASDHSQVEANAGAVAVAAALSTTGSAVGVSLGASLAMNTVHNSAVALVDASKLRAGDDVSLLAQEEAAISALALGGALSVGLTSTGAGVAVAGAGAATISDISLATEAGIRNGSDVQTSGGSVALRALNAAEIDADAGGVALSLAYTGTGTAVAVSVGAAAAINRIDSSSLASIDASQVKAYGEVSLLAEDQSTISALAIGAAGAAAISGSRRQSAARASPSALPAPARPLTTALRWPSRRASGTAARSTPSAATYCCRPATARASMAMPVASPWPWRWHRRTSPWPCRSGPVRPSTASAATFWPWSTLPSSPLPVKSH
ncbi:MAG: hypothetical protein AW10_02278 [Candidatus Accumulibacter appositus]|uniref:LEPR-XLL domain-containing protein n=1 Tax=Candidatus Accumulibacter appositus TaxID=1454003 RepID=A0A011PRR8_9PROT|nr:MAG: hypothetical protein AW10_02278 [Candidatus Accumulibacter appositus]